MNDFNYLVETLAQYATGSITYGVPVGADYASGVITYNTPVGADYATGTITYNTPVGADYASGTITVSDYLQLIAAQATGTITIVDYTLLTGATVTVDSVTYTEGVDWTAATSNDATATSLAAAIDAGAQGAAAVGAVVTVTAAAAGEAGNAIDLASSDGTNAPVSGATLTGGQDNASYTLNDVTVVQGTDFTAATSNDATATSLASALDAAANVGATAATNVVTCKADARGTAANAYVFTQDVTGGSAISGSGTLAGGVDGDRVAVDGSFQLCVASSPGANEFSSIAELTALIDALGTVSATDDGSTITVVAASRGTGGNAITMAVELNGGGDIAVSGATLAGGVDGDTVSVDGNVFTCVVGTAGANEFSNITELEALVEAVANIDSVQDGSVVNITYSTRGTAGNAVTLALGGSNAGTMAISGATLSGGVDGDTVAVDGNTFTCVVGTAGANEFSSISELEALVEAVSDITSSQDGTTVSIAYNIPGTAGNAITLALGGSNAGTMAVSGATLSGGVDSTATDDFQIDLTKAEVLKVYVEVANLTSGATLTITPQVSVDADDWQNLPAFTIGADGDTVLEVSNLLEFVRFSVVVNQAAATTPPTADITLHAIPGTSEQVESVAGPATLLSAQLFDNTTTSANSDAIDASQYDHFLLFLDMQKANNPTNLTFKVQLSDDGGTTWYDYEQGVFASLIFNQSQMGSRIYRCYSGRCMGKQIRVQASATGTSAVNTFTTTVKMMLKN